LLVQPGSRNATAAAISAATSALALADHMRGEDIITACFFGDGAIAEGEFHESLNLAALWSLPVLCSCARTISTT
jgi:TPP-dependent pyruvate/acetoin dehydrogenase alpha subunit